MDPSTESDAGGRNRYTRMCLTSTYPLVLTKRGTYLHKCCFLALEGRQKLCGELPLDFLLV